MTGLKEFLENISSEEVGFPLTCPNQLIKEIQKLGGTVDMESMDTNGWQWDYWFDGEYKGKTFVISGSGFYGNGRIRWTSEDED